MSGFRLGEQFPTLGPIIKKAPSIVARACQSVARASLRVVKRTWRWGLGILFGLVAAHTVATVILGRQLAAEVEKIRAAGEYVSCKELAGPAIPDSENGALIYEEAFKLLPKPALSKQATPPPLDSHASAAALWEEASAQARMCPPQVFPLVERAQALKQCRFKADWGDGPVATTPHCSKLYRLAQILAADAVVKARDGDSAGACRRLWMLFTLQESIKDDPALWCCQDRARIIALGLDAIVRMAEFAPLPERDARKLSDYISTINLTPGFVNAMRGHRAWLIEFFDIVREQGNPIEDLSGGNPPLVNVVDLYFSYPGRPWFYRDERNLLREVTNQITLAACPYREVGPGGWERAGERIEESGWVGAILGSILCGDFGRTHGEVETAHAQLGASRILLALSVYRGRSGAYPARLADLDQALHWNLNLQDPFSGKDFVYKRQGSGFVLYSVGPNLKDDGGVQSDYWDEGDIVWRIDR